MVLDASEAEARYNDMLMKELTNLREDIKDLRKDVQDSNKNCSTRSIDCGKNFVSNLTHWKTFGITLALIFGAFSFTGGVLQYTIKHIMIQ